MKPLAFLLLSLLSAVGQEPTASNAATEPETPASQEVVDPVASREMIHQWVQTERLLSEEKTTWQVEKKQMQSLLDLYQKELELLDEELGQAGSSANALDERQQSLSRGVKEYRAAQVVLTESLARMLPRVKKLIIRLPEPLKQDLKADIELLSSESALKTPRDVLKSMLQVFAASGRFNRSITLAEETRTVEGGKKMTVDVLYLGLACAYYASTSGASAGTGTPGRDAWVWTESPEISEDILKAIAVYRKDSQPRLVDLPVKISAANQ